MKTFIHRDFWSDPDIEALSAEQKLAVLWIWTNPKMNCCGFCEVSDRRFTFETGLPPEALESAVKALPRAFKRFGGIVYSRKFIRYQFGTGDALLRNNCFKSVRSVFQAVDLKELREALAEDYPDLLKDSEALPKPLKALPNPSEGGDKVSPRGKGKGKGKGKGTGKVHDDTEADTESVDLPELAREIVSVYPRRDFEMDCAQAVLDDLTAGEDPQQLREAVSLCAEACRKAPGGAGNRRVPMARNFFQGRQWRNPEVLQNRWLNDAPVQGQTSPTPESHFTPSTGGDFDPMAEFAALRQRREREDKIRGGEIEPENEEEELLCR